LDLAVRSLRFVVRRVVGFRAQAPDRDREEVRVVLVEVAELDVLVDPPLELVGRVVLGLAEFAFVTLRPS
jgi:hypothetical protein